MDADELTGIQGILARGERAARSAAQEDLPESDDDDALAAFRCGRIGTRPQLMIVFRKSSGEVFAFSYAHLDKIHAHDVSRGFTLDFGDAVVAVAGRNLERLFRCVCDHKAAEIAAEGRAAEFIAEDAEPVVTSITVAVKRETLTTAQRQS